jgi:hypothetical protein
MTTGRATCAVRPHLTNRPPGIPGTSPNGLGDTAQVLASAPGGQGFGTNTLSAALVLDIPTASPAGAYSGLLTITYLETGPVQIVVTFP